MGWDSAVLNLPCIR